MKILFWLNGRTWSERKVMDFPSITPENISKEKHIINKALEDWHDRKDCHSVRWGWDVDLEANETI